MLWGWLILIIGGLAIWFLENQSLKDPERRITYEVSFGKRRAEQGTPVAMDVKISNHSRMPVFYLEFIQNFTNGLMPYLPEIKGEKEKQTDYIDGKTETLSAIKVEKDSVDVRNRDLINDDFIKNHYSVFAGIASIKDSCYVPGLKTVTRTYPLVAEQRGCYRISGSHVSVGDFMGIKQSLFSLNLSGELLVLPRKSNRSDLPVTMANILGDLSVQRFVFEDPIMTVGFSDYTGREPQKAISWTGSARAGRMLVKKYDHTAERTVTILLDIEKAGEELEECFSLTRSVCEELERARISWGFYTNANLFSSQGVSGSAQGSGQMHLNRVLEGLARANGSLVCSADKMLSKLCRSDLDSAGYLIIQPASRPELKGRIRELRAASGSVIYLLYAKGGGERC